MAKGVYAAAFLIVLGPSIPRLTGACTMPPRYNAYFGEAPATPGDTTPPTFAVTYHIERPDLFGCGCGHHCPVRAFVVLEPSSTDDQTAPEFISYHLEFVAGIAPTTLARAVEGHARFVGIYSDGMIGLDIDPDDDDFSFDLQITAIDLSGNESEPIVLRIAD